MYHFFENLSTNFLVIRIFFDFLLTQLHICGHTTSGSRLLFWRLKSTTPTKELSRSKDNLSSCQRKRGPINETKGDQKSPNQVFPLPYYSISIHMKPFIDFALKEVWYCGPTISVQKFLYVSIHFAFTRKRLPALKFNTTKNLKTITGTSWVFYYFLLI